MGTYQNVWVENLNKPIYIILASRSRLFLEGIRKILEDETGIKIVAEFLNREEIERYTTIIKPEFILLDNTTLELDINKLIGLINEKSLNTKVILLSGYSRYKSNSPNIIYIDKNIGPSELVRTIIRSSPINRI